MAVNYALNLALRVLQLICAIVVMITDGYGAENYYLQPRLLRHS